MLKEEKVLNYLDELDIKYDLIRHKPLFTMEDVSEVDIKGIDPKNIVLKDKKKDKFYLLILEADERLDSKWFRNLTGSSSKITFVNEEELDMLFNIKTGACSVFSLLEDVEDKVALVIPKLFWQLDGEEIINFHPNINTATVSLKVSDFKKYVNSLQNEIIVEK